MADRDRGGDMDVRLRGEPSGGGSSNDANVTSGRLLVNNQRGLDHEDAGLTPSFDSDIDNSAQTLSASETNLHGIELQNINAVDCWLQLFDHASPTVGTTTPVLSFLVPAGNGTNYGALSLQFDPPVKFSTACTYAATTTPTGNGDPSTGLVGNFLRAPS